MKLTKAKLKQIINEEKTKALKERWENKETSSPLAAFGQAWSNLGWAVQEQVLDLINASTGGESGFYDAAHEINPSALDMAMRSLKGSLTSLESGGSKDARDLLNALDHAKEIIRSDNRGEQSETY